jgi:hypothetical protein
MKTKITKIASPKTDNFNPLPPKKKSLGSTSLIFIYSLPLIHSYRFFFLEFFMASELKLILDPEAGNFITQQAATLGCTTSWD